ncbi:MAG: FAD-binding oxidoreductase, partial [Actinomycetaceae bacterium]|nr:FAD-binding oxidoreductase [Actinomycetaceae bacterium]
MSDAELAARLREVVRGEVDNSTRRRAEYSTDASLYRIAPRIVVFPRDAADVEATLTIARETGVPFTSRGAGTSTAGNSIGAGIVLDFSRYMNKIIEIDPEARTARVQPGVILSDLQKEAAKHGLRFGPDPSTQNRATFGGSIGNNACGAHALSYGRTSDNVVELTALLADGRTITAGEGCEQIEGLAELADSHLAAIRTHMGTFKRQVSGYALEHLLPENGRNLAKFLVGSEGTLAITLEAVVRLVPVPASPALVVLGFPDMPSAADDVMTVLDFEPLAVEGMNDEMVEAVRRHKGSVPALPEGG